MIRRFSAALIGLALCLPVFAVPVAAHGATPFVVDYNALADNTLVGTVVNHTSSRRFNIEVTAVYENGTTDITATATVLVSNLAPHNAAPFRLDPVADVTGLAINSVTATGAVTGTSPTGGLHVDPCTFVGDVCTGNVTNDGAADAVNVEVYATRGADATTHTDAAASETILSIAPAGSAEYSITFADGSSGEEWNLIAKTNGGAFYTSWNNYFRDLVNTSESFVDEIAWMADTGITTGCGAAIYCPKSNVSRGQMAVFLARALSLPLSPAPADQGFTDLDGLSESFVNAINAVAIDGITSGCSVTPKKFCPGSSVTRGQMSVFIVKGYDLTPIAGAGIFTDDDGHFSETYNNRMAADGITSGCSATKFCPNSNVLREQMAVFLFRASNPGP